MGFSIHLSRSIDIGRKLVLWGLFWVQHEGRCLQIHAWLRDRKLVFGGVNYFSHLAQQEAFMGNFLDLLPYY